MTRAPRTERVVVRLTREGLTLIDEWAADEERDRSSMVRALLKEAVEARLRRGQAAPRASLATPPSGERAHG